MESNVLIEPDDIVLKTLIFIHQIAALIRERMMDKGGKIKKYIYVIANKTY